MKKLLLVIDMVNGFVKEGALADKAINNITPNIINLIKKYVQEENDIISIQEGHNENSKEFKPYESNMKLIRKNSTSGFLTKEFYDYIKNNENNLKEIALCGCCTDLCVMNFAIPLKNYINENDLDIDVVIYKNAVETYDAPNHNKKEYNEIAFKIMEQNGIKLI